MPGLGEGLQGFPIVGADQLHVGADVPGFPATFQHLHMLTEAQMSRLSALYNEDFGIVAGDTLGVQQLRFHEYVSM